MGKRLPVKSVPSAIETLNTNVNDDAAAKQSQERKLEMVRNINKPEYITEVPVDLIFTNFELNPRENDSYGIDANAELFDSLKTYGIDPSKPPITLSRKSDGRYLTLRGNLRMSIVREMNAENDKAGLPVRFPTVPALVYTGLTPEEEILILADHTGQKELNRYELALMVGRASLARRWTDKEGASYFGLGASTVQRLRQQFLMPPVLDDLKKEVHLSRFKGGDVPEEHKPYVFTQKECATLYNGYNSDQAINPIPRWTDGPNFKQAWDGVMDARRGVDKAPPVKPRKAAELDSMVNTFVGSPAETVSDAAKLVSWAKGDNSETGYEIMSRIKAADDKKTREIADLTNEVTALRADLADAIRTINRKVDDIRDLEQTIVGLKEENESLRADNRALADMIPTPVDPVETPENV